MRNISSNQHYLLNRVEFYMKVEDCFDQLQKPKYAGLAMTKIVSLRGERSLLDEAIFPIHYKANWATKH